MPARSKSQQRLFGMVHAYNKGELHGSRALLRRISAISKNISEEDAEHFARTKHKDLPEKKAQVMRPDEVRDLYAKIPAGVYAGALTERSERRRSFLGRIFSGAAAGTLVGGLGAGAFSAYVANQVAKDNPRISHEELVNKMREAGIRGGLWGAGKGAIAGSVVGAGLGILDKLRGA